jgi:hypothetical protein
MTYTYTPEKRYARLEERIPLFDGRMFHPQATHGTWSGYTYWCCRCDECRVFGRLMTQRREDRRRHNRRILAHMLHGSPLESPLQPRETFEVTPEQFDELTRQAEEAIRAGGADPITDDDLDEVPAFTWPEGLAIPIISPGARTHVRNREHLVDIARAVQEPEVVLPVSDREGWTRRKREPVMVVVARDGTIVNIADYTADTGPSELLDAAPKALPKAKGGRGGRRRFGSTDDLIAELRRLKIPMERTGGDHLKVRCPDGSFYITASTGSDWRGVLNAMAELRAKGVPL